MNTTWNLRRRGATIFASLAVALWASHATAAVSVRVEAQPVADPIRVSVSVTDSSGAPVTGLAASDFTLQVDGTTVPSPSFSLPPSQDGSRRVSVVFAMDMSQSVQSTALQAMQDALTEFINAMHDGDYAAVVKFNNTNPDKASVVQSFTAIDNGAGDTALISAVNAPYNGSGSNIFDGVALSIEQFKTPSVSLPAGPKAVLLVSDGRDNASTTTLDAVITSANQQHIPVFTIGVGDVATNGGEKTLKDLAAGTGGTYLAAPTSSQISDAYQQISTMLNNEYLLTFSSSITDCNTHKLTTQVTGQTSVDTNFQRCTASGGGGGGGGSGDGGGGGGGGATGLVETLLLGTGFLALRRRRRRASEASGSL
jgi:VWFA-related protein